MTKSQNYYEDRFTELRHPRTADSRCDDRSLRYRRDFRPLRNDTPLFSLLMVVKRQAVFWQERLTALKAGAIATGGR
jgi:hypothetical protein